MVSHSAYDCPNCGARLRRRLYEVGPFTTAVVLVPLILIVMVMFLGMCSEG
jgi:hypothetical protein